MDMGFCTWNVRGLYRAGSLVSVSKYKLHLAGVQAGNYTFFQANGNENNELDAGFFFFVHKRIYQQLRVLSLLVIGCHT
jgi:hypothetical protein